jgi:hypothetical protein
MRHKLTSCAVRLDGYQLRRTAWSYKKGVLGVRFRTRGNVSHLGILDRARHRASR